MMWTLGIVTTGCMSTVRRSSMVWMGPEWTFQLRKRVTGRTPEPAPSVPPHSVRLGSVSPADPVMLRATGLGRRFGELWAVRGIDLEVHRGEVLGLLGPNGAGKTTTVRMLTALIARPRDGDRSTVWMSRDDPEDVRPRVGILTETPGLYEKLSATANLDFFGRLYGLDADDAGGADRALPAALLAVGPARRPGRQHSARG